MFNEFQDLWLLFKLNRPRRLTRQIVEYAVDAFHLIDDAGHNFEQHVKRDFCSFCGHKIRCDDCAQRNCIIVGSFIAHNANRTHVGQRCKELSQFLVAACFGKLFAVDSVCILNDANFLRSHLAYNTNTQTRTGEGLDALNDLLEKLLTEELIYVERVFPYQEAGKIQLIREFGQLISEEYTESGITVKARVPREIYPQVV